MAGKQIYREQSLERISSPEQLNDYLKVTKPTVWAVLAAVILLLAGLLIWSMFAEIGSYANGTALVKNGSMTVRFEDQTFARNVKEGMEVMVGETSCPIISVGTDQNGEVFATAETALDDGTYKAAVKYRQIQAFSLLFSNE